MKNTTPEGMGNIKCVASEGTGKEYMEDIESKYAELRVANGAKRC